MERIGIGYDNYKDFKRHNIYYVDKTLLVRDVLEKGGKVTLFTRPRRFGKTLALSMLRTFFELEYDENGNIVDNSEYFAGRDVMGCSDEILRHMGRYPVINMSLKSTKQKDFLAAFSMLRKEIVFEFDRHSYLENSPMLNEREKERFRELWLGENVWEERLKNLRNDRERREALAEEAAKYAAALKELSFFLKKHHGINVIIMIDEYDVPLENAWHENFYQEMIGFMRSLFESALKSNDALERAIITGCLRISRESIFIGMNNLEIISVRSSDFSGMFGFTQAETEQFLSDFNLSQKFEELKEWYDGYLFGREEIYNPWSVTKYVKAHLSEPDCFPEAYWSNTSSNEIIRDMVSRADNKVRRELDVLVEGGCIEKRIHEDITYADIYQSEDNLWNFLFFTGYMKKVSERQEGEDIFVTMCIPNREIKSIYRHQIREWFDKIIENADRENLYKAIQTKNTERMSNILTELLKRSISTFDSDEGFYHGFLLSMLIGMTDYAARSNREERDGKPDITLYPENPLDPAYVFELKVRKKFNEMQNGLAEAYRQIDEKRYVEGLLEDGYAGAISFGVCFCKKSCIVGLHGHVNAN